LSIITGKKQEEAGRQNKIEERGKKRLETEQNRRKRKEEAGRQNKIEERSKKRLEDRTK